MNLLELVVGLVLTAVIGAGYGIAALFVACLASAFIGWPAEIFSCLLAGWWFYGSIDRGDFDGLYRWIRSNAPAGLDKLFWVLLCVGYAFGCTSFGARISATAVGYPTADMASKLGLMI